MSFRRSEATEEQDGKSHYLEGEGGNAVIVRLDGQRVQVAEPPWSKRHTKGVVGIAHWVVEIRRIPGVRPILDGHQYWLEPDNADDSDKAEGLLFGESELCLNQGGDGNL